MTTSTALKSAHTVSVRDLTVRHRRTTALDGVGLALGTGVHGLLGPNGAGKTSLVRVLATVAPPDSGDVRLLGHAVAGRDAAHAERTALRRRLGYLPQDFGYYPRFTVREFVAYVAWLKEMPGPAAASAVERAVERVGLSDRIDARMRTLSGGMVRRVGIAQALVNDPDLVLLDEPTAGLDPEQRVEFRALLRELGTTATVIVATHLVEDVAAACTNVTLLEAGRVAYQGTPKALAALGEAAGEAPGRGGPDVSDGGPGGPGGGSSGVSGDSPIERGYLAALRRHRADSASGARS